MINLLTSPDIKKLLILAILLRLLIMPFFYHPDIKTYSFQSSFLRQGVLDIYSYLTANKDKLPLKEEFVYFPLTYYFLGSYQIIASPILGNNFIDWLFDASQSSVETVGIFKYLFLLKLPYLILDLALAFLLASMFVGENKKRVFALWLFNPFSIVLIYVFSNIDIIPVFFTVASLAAIKKERFYLSALLLGLGAGFKAYPLLFLPFLILVIPSLKQKILTSLIGMGTFLAIIIPFLLSAGFREATLASGLTTRIISEGISIGFGENIFLGIVAYSILFFLGFSTAVNIKTLWKYYLSSLLLIFSFIHFHIQWLLWLIPLSSILLVTNKKLSPLVYILIMTAFLIPFLYNDKYMSVSLFSVISPLFTLIPSPYTIVEKISNPFVIQSVLHSILLGGSLVLIGSILKNQES